MSAITHHMLASTLVDAGLLIATSVQGVYGQGDGFAIVADAVSATLRRTFGFGSERMRFASVMPREDLEAIGYFRNFPHLLGTIHCFCGDEAAHRELVRHHDAGDDWTGRQQASDLVLIPAACYSVYPVLARRGAVPADGFKVQVEANCFRREPSDDPVRLQSFHMHELVRVGTADQAIAFRDDWLARGAALLDDWGLETVIDAADDPFFGRAAVVMGKAQRQRELKFEVKIPVSNSDRLTACMSANYHLDSFGRALGMTQADGSPAHSACVGFGIERVTLALFRRHGADLAAWPATVCDKLGLCGSSYGQ